jgi:hypothetical protein
MPSLAGVPVVCYNNYKEATVWEIVTENASILDYNYFHITKPTDPDPLNPTLTKLWRPFVFTDSLYGSVDYDGSASAPQKDAGSGSPLFLVFTNSAGQSQFVYFGSVVAPDDLDNGVYYGAIGPSYKAYYSAIRAAVNTLNADPKGGNGRDLQPVVVANTQWSSSLMNGLVAYWKMDESGGSRADSHGGNNLTQTGTVGQTSGKVYPYAADFYREDGGEYLQSGYGVPVGRTVTVSAWCFGRDWNHTVMPLVSKTIADINPEWAIEWRHDPPYSRFRFSIHTYHAVDSPYAEAGVWHHVLAWHDLAHGTSHIRLNGGVTISFEGGWINDFGYPINVGSLGNQNLTWCGHIGPVAIWNRVLLPEEQNDVWNYGAGAVYPFPLVNY